MRKLYIAILGLVLSATACASLSGQNYKNFSKELNTQELSRIYKSSGIDDVSDRFNSVSDKLKAHFKAKKSKNGFKATTKIERDSLVLLMESASFVTTQLEGSQMHLYGVAELYKEAPKDVNLAIERSALKRQDKDILKETLRNLQHQL